MEVRLVLEKGRKPVKVFRLRKDESVVGRAKGSDLRIPSAEVSRRHCLLNSKRGFLLAEDLGSANGTLLNGEPIAGKQVVRPGDHLTIGPVTFVVEYQLTQTAIDAMLKGAAEPPGEEEVISADVLDDHDEESARAEEEDSPLKFDEEESSASVDQEEELPLVEPADEEDEIVDVDVLEAAAEYDKSSSEGNPEPDQLRNMLADMDDAPKAPPPKSRRKK